MQQREKLLLAGLLTVGGLWFAKDTFKALFVTPLSERAEQITSLTQEVSDKGVSEVQLMKAQARLKGYKRQSLPPNPQDAHRLYLEWITDIAQIAGLSDLKITINSQQAVENTFVTIPVTIVGEATTEQVLRFVRLFESADLLHRLAKFHAVSPSSDGDPRLTVTIGAEGLAMRDAKPRSRLFPLATLASDLDARGTTLQVSDAKEFTLKPPFLVRSGHEFLHVTAVDGNTWTVERGVDQTIPQEHLEGSSVELFPIRPPSTDGEDPRAILARLGAGRFFAKPQPPVVYRPRFASISDQRATRGVPYTYTFKVEGWNPAFGKPVFELGDGTPDGMKLDPATGAVTWTPPTTLKLGPVALSAVARPSNNNGDPISTKFTLDVRPDNHAPTLSVPQAATVYLGRNATIELKGADVDLPDDRLTYSFEGEAPAGARIDSRTGRIDWVAPPETELGSKTFNVAVSDNGDPALKATAVLNVKFEDDAAAYTYLVGCLAEGEGKGEAILHDRTTNQTLRLHPGDLIRRADLELVVLTVQPGDMVFASGPDIFRLDFGKPLRQAERLPPPRQPVSGTPAPAGAASSPTAAEPGSGTPK